jgi:hypothetical protein
VFRQNEVRVRTNQTEEVNTDTPNQNGPKQQGESGRESSGCSREKGSFTMPEWAFREMVGLPPNPNAPASPAPALDDVSDEVKTGYPFIVELRNGEVARFSTKLCAEEFKESYTTLVK